MGKDIRQIYKHIQSKLSTLSLKAPVSSSSPPQTSKTTSIPSVREKNQSNSVLYSQNTTQNCATITNNGIIQSCETPHNFHAQRISSMSSSTLTSNTPMILTSVGK